jgi:pyruvate dehydrogenase E2 component (dihydrolipoamide acetyltransferase)
MAEGIKAIKMPKWGLAMTEGTVVAWYVEEGDELKAGGDLIEIETPKITNLYESPVSGRLRKRVAQIGETLPVGALLAVVADEATSDTEVDAFIAKFAEDFVPEAESGADALQPQMITAGERRIRYLKMGEGERAPVLLIHGFGGDLNSWLFNQPVLGQARAAYSMDLPGHGQSSKQVDSGDFGSFVSAVFALMEALEIGDAHLVGHSLGGAIALELALSHPECVRSFTLIAPAGLGPEINIDYIQGFIRANRHKQLRPIVEQLFADPSLVGRKMLDDIISFKRIDGAVEALSTIAAAVFPDGRQSVNLAPRLADLKIPIQVIWGERDQIIPASHLKALPPSVATHLVAGAGHMVHMEKADEVNPLIESFLAD